MKIPPTENIKPGEHMFKKSQRFLMLLELESSRILTTDQKNDITTATEGHCSNGLNMLLGMCTKLIEKTSGL